jgi:hypothetical protein
MPTRETKWIWRVDSPRSATEVRKIWREVSPLRMTTPESPTLSTITPKGRQRVLSTETKVALHVSPANFSTAAVRVSGWQVPCPDLRGYWGDYDSMTAGSDGLFHRVFSDSTGGACTAQAYASTPLGVSESVIPIPP